VGIIEILTPLLLDVSAVEIEKHGDNHDNWNAVHNVSSKCQLATQHHKTYQTPRAMGNVSEFPPTGFSHMFGSEQSAVVVAARGARTGEGTLKPSVEVIVPILSRALIAGTRGPMA
jgi:hypothetical protein